MDMFATVTLFVMLLLVYPIVFFFLLLKLWKKDSENTLLREDIIILQCQLEKTEDKLVAEKEKQLLANRNTKWALWKRQALNN